MITIAPYRLTSLFKQTAAGACPCDENRGVKKGDSMKKELKKKLTLSKETIASLEADKLAEVLGGLAQAPVFSDKWEVTTCM